VDVHRHATDSALHAFQLDHLGDRVQVHGSVAAVAVAVSCAGGVVPRDQRGAGLLAADGTAGAMGAAAAAGGDGDVAARADRLGTGGGGLDGASAARGGGELGDAGAVCRGADMGGAVVAFVSAQR